MAQKVKDPAWSLHKTQVTAVAHVQSLTQEPRHAMGAGEKNLAIDKTFQRIINIQVLNTFINTLFFF